LEPPNPPLLLLLFITVAKQLFESLQVVARDTNESDERHRTCDPQRATIETAFGPEIIILPVFSDAMSVVQVVWMKI
jgi:hypothetical protein